MMYLRSQGEKLTGRSWVGQLVSRQVTYAVVGIFSLLSALCFAAVPVNINEASVEEIATNLAGIGTKKAQAIVDYREKFGDFKTVFDLTEVKGIGDVTVEKNKALIVIEPQEVVAN